MSCIRFNTPAQRQAMRDHAPHRLGAGTAAAAQTCPPVTESKIARLRLLARSPDPKIRESVASSSHAPNDLLADLALDPDEGVRACVARNEAASCDVLRSLRADRSERVRGWLAVNFFVPADVMQSLAGDSSETVRRLVAWKTALAET